MSVLTDTVMLLHILSSSQSKTHQRKEGENMGEIFQILTM